MVKFPCIQSDIGQTFGIQFLLQEKKRVINTYPDVIASVDTTDDLVIAYSNSEDHYTAFIRSFLLEDEVISTLS